MQANYKREIISSNTKGVQSPKVGSDGIYHILYMTTCISTNKVYIGIHSTTNHNDNYIGCGIYTTHKEAWILGSNSGKSHFVRSILKYGTKAHIRENILYFDSREDVLGFEADFVTKDLINKSDILNSTIGGSSPPVRCGTDNGNYGNYWSDEQRQMARSRMLGRYDGSDNPNAKPMVAINVVTLEVEKFDSITDFADKYGFKARTAHTFLSKGGFKVVFKKFILIKLDEYNDDFDYSSIIEDCVTKSRFKNIILKQRNDSKKH